MNPDVTIEKLLSGGDLRSIGKSNSVVSKIKNKNDFDELFKCLFHKDRIVVMRAADAIEKITISNPSYLLQQKKKILELCSTAKDKELKWHLALMVPRVPRFKYADKARNNIWNLLSQWTTNKDESKIVRVNSLQGLYELSKQERELTQNLMLIFSELEKENIPSINARIKNIRKQLLAKK